MNGIHVLKNVLTSYNPHVSHNIDYINLTCTQEFFVAYWLILHCIKIVY